MFPWLRYRIGLLKKFHVRALMNKNILVCAVSSIEPSELTAILLLSLSELEIASLQKTILIEDCFVQKEYNHDYNYFPNYSFPAYQIHRLDKEKYSPLYFSLTEKGALNSASNNILHKIKKFDGEMSAFDCDIVNKIERINTLIRNKETDRLANIILHLLNHLKVNEVSILNYSEYLNSEEGSATSIVKFYKFLDVLPKNKWIKLARAGSVIFVTDNNRIECSSFFIGTDTIKCKDKDGNEALLTRNRQEIIICGKKEKIIHLRYKGVSINLHLCEIGLLPHAPWYCSITQDLKLEETVECIEVISPIANVDTYRVSLQCNGKGVRLSPSAYTLLDYKHEKVLRYIELMIQSEVDNFEDFYDWVRLINNFPVATQKPSKNSRQVRKYVNAFIQNDKTHFDSGLYSALTINGVQGLGVKMRVCIDQLNRLRRYLVTGEYDEYLDCYFFNKERSILNHEIVYFIDVKKKVQSLLKESSIWRGKIAMDISDDRSTSAFDDYC